MDEPHHIDSFPELISNSNVCLHHSWNTHNLRRGWRFSVSALKLALSQANETDTSSVISMLICICKVMLSLPHTLQYICPLFWLTVALLQSSHMSFYVEATQLLGVTLENMELWGMLLRTLLCITVWLFEKENEGVNRFRDSPCPDALGYFLA